MGVSHEAGGCFGEGVGRTLAGMTSLTSAELLAAYDENLRTDAEVAGAVSVAHDGPLVLARFGADHLFVTYRTLEGHSIPELVSRVRKLLDADTSITEAEWKTRGHDHAPGLEDALLAAGFQRDLPESVMLGEASLLATATAPDGVSLRQVRSAADIRAALDMQDTVFGGNYADRLVPEILERQAAGDPVEIWTATVDGRIVCAGRIDPVPGTAFAGVWGGATLPEYRGRGIYRALTAARVRSVMEHGVRFIHSDSSDDSRPILERAGLMKVTTTTPWRWLRR